MLTPIKMPKLGETMEEGTILSWLVKEGEKVEKGDILFEIETDKVSMEYESPVSGVLKKIVAAEGDTLPIQEIVAYIGDPEDEVPESLLQAKKDINGGKARKEKEESTEDQAKPEVPDGSGQEANRQARKFASPRARIMAEKLGVDLKGITGSGYRGRIRTKDVIRETPENIDGKVVPVKGMRKVIAERMLESFRDTPHFYLKMDVNMLQVTKLREKLLGSWEEKYDFRLSYNDFFVKATATAMAENPEMNVRYINDNVYHNPQINIGVAVSVPEGLIVPVIRNTEQLSLRDLAVQIRELTNKARNGDLSPDEYKGGCFTVSNLGMYGVSEFSAIINPPESGILAVGAVENRVIPVAGKVEISPICSLTLSLDHKVVDGTLGAKFLACVKACLEDPFALLS